MPNLKLTYFNIKARGEPIRLALAVQGIPFEDERLSGEQFGQLKASGGLPFDQLPVLTVDNKIIAQSTAILRYVGRLGKTPLYPTDPYLAAVVDQVISQVQDVEGALKPSGAEADVEKKLALRAKLATETFPKLFKQLDTFIEKHQAELANISIGHLFLYQMNTSYSAGAYDGIPKTILEPYENIKKIVAQVKANPAVVQWESTH
ncbi:glutathione S-transferase [Globomyces pollinis-pini]|nr:glutathione S-transferase [Globomyces pollinis-pini]